MARFRFAILMMALLALGCDVRGVLGQRGGSATPGATQVADAAAQDASAGPRQGDATNGYGQSEAAPAPVPASDEGYQASEYRESEQPDQGGGYEPSQEPGPSEASGYEQPASYQSQQTETPGRITYLSGQVYVKGRSDEDWSQADLNLSVLPGDSYWAEAGSRAELELASGVLLRMAQNAKVDVATIQPSILLKGWVGAFFVKVPASYRNAINVEAPGASIELHGGSYLRVDIAEDGYTRYTVYSGEAGVAEPGGVRSVPAVSRFYVEPGELPSDVEPVAEGSTDDFDTWATERDTERPDAYESPSYRRIGGDVRGASDLDRTGSWVQIENREYYRPAVTESWRPYSNGYWTVEQPYGYVWISYDPFGYTTHHYGRWFFRTGYGWLWYPGTVWAPHYCYFASYGDSIYWAPYDPWGRPAYLGRADVVITGGINVDFRAWSMMPVRAFQAGARSVVAVHSGLFRGPMQLHAVAAPHKVFAPVFHARTPFLTVGGVKVSQRMASVHVGLAKVPDPGLHLALGKYKEKSKPPQLKLKVNEPAAAFQVKLPKPSKGPAYAPPASRPAAPQVSAPKPPKGPAYAPPAPRPAAPQVSAPKPPKGPAYAPPAPRPAPRPAQVNEPRGGGKKGETYAPPAPRPAPRPAQVNEPRGGGKKGETYAPPAPRPAPRPAQVNEPRGGGKKGEASAPRPAPRMSEPRGGGKKADAYAPRPEVKRRPESGMEPRKAQSGKEEPAKSRPSKEQPSGKGKKAPAQDDKDEKGGKGKGGKGR